MCASRSSFNSSLPSVGWFLWIILIAVLSFGTNAQRASAQSNGTINGDPQASYPPRGVTTPSDGLFLYNGQELVQINEIVQQTRDLGLVYGWGIELIPSFDGLPVAPYSYPTVLMQSSKIQPASLSLVTVIGGAGMQVYDFNGQVLVNPSVNSPARDAGIQGGDILLAVDGNAIHGDVDYAKSLIRGRPDTPVSLTLLQGTRSHTVTINRRVIDAEFVGINIEPWDNNSVTLRPTQALSEGIHCFGYFSSDPNPNSFAEYVNYACFEVSGSISATSTSPAFRVTYSNNDTSAIEVRLSDPVSNPDGSMSADVAVISHGAITYAILLEVTGEVSGGVEVLLNTQDPPLVLTGNIEQPLGTITFMPNSSLHITANKLGFTRDDAAMVLGFDLLTALSLAGGVGYLPQQPYYMLPTISTSFAEWLLGRLDNDGVDIALFSRQLAAGEYIGAAQTIGEVVARHANDIAVYLLEHYGILIPRSVLERLAGGVAVLLSAAEAAPVVSDLAIMPREVRIEIALSG